MLENRGATCHFLWFLFWRYLPETSQLPQAKKTAKRRPLLAGRITFTFIKCQVHFFPPEYQKIRNNFMLWLFFSTLNVFSKTSSEESRTPPNTQTVEVSEGRGPWKPSSNQDYTGQFSTHNPDQNPTWRGGTVPQPSSASASTAGSKQDFQWADANHAHRSRRLVKGLYSFGFYSTSVD